MFGCAIAVCGVSRTVPKEEPFVNISAEKHTGTSFWVHNVRRTISEHDRPRVFSLVGQLEI